MTNQYALGYKAGLEAAVKVCSEYAIQSSLFKNSAAEGVALVLLEAIAALPIPDHLPDATKMVALTTEQAQQIEEAFVTFTSVYFEERHRKVATKALAIIREARAQEQAGQEPVAFDENNLPIPKTYPAMPMTMRLEQVEAWNRKGWIVEPLYAAPVSAKREWVDLTDDEILTAANVSQEDIYDLDLLNVLSDVRAIIAKFKEKNTLPAIADKPVAWMDNDGNVCDHNEFGCFNIPLYTTPPVVPQGEPSKEMRAARQIRDSAFDKFCEMKASGKRLISIEEAAQVIAALQLPESKND